MFPATSLAKQLQMLRKYEWKETEVARLTHMPEITLPLVLLEREH